MGKSGSEDMSAQDNGIHIVSPPSSYPVTTYDQWAYDDDGTTWIRDMAFPRVREGVERFFITDINNPASGSTGQSTLVVMSDAFTLVDRMESDRPGVTGGAMQKFNHIPGGANVLYMDGHVEFNRLGNSPVNVGVENKSYGWLRGIFTSYVSGDG
jgi:prepilin-type processing-associated H-X9-DG protein